VRDKIVLLQANLTGPRPLAGIRNEIAFNIVAAYQPLAIIYTNPLTRTCFSVFCFVPPSPRSRCHFIPREADPGASESLIFYPELCRNLTVPVFDMGFRASAELVALLETNVSITVRLDIGGSNLPQPTAARTSSLTCCPSQIITFGAL
jgi:hypothetical protein